MSSWAQLMLQDAASPIMFQLITLHDHAMLIITMVITFVSYMLISLMVSRLTSRQLLEANTLETIWTILPALILIFLALPSLRLLYLIDEIPNPLVSIKTIGRQWYWTYEYLDQNSTIKAFDSIMKKTTNLNTLEGEFRLLEVDNRAVLPMMVEVQLLATSSDVIHSWAMPSLGIKIDAIPGRQNQVGFYITRPGVYYGQCSEICGTDHSFMPIVVEAISFSNFKSWVNP